MFRGTPWIRSLQKTKAKGFEGGNLATIFSDDQKRDQSH